MARFLVRRTTAPFDALYELPPSVPSRPSMLAILTRLPERCSIIRVSACLHTMNVPVRLTRMTRSHSAAARRWIGPPPATPAAFRTTSSRPWSATIASIASATAASSVTSTICVSPSGPGSRSTPATFAPSSANRRAHASPIPDAAPVTSATLPSRRPTTVCSLKRVLVVKTGVPGREVRVVLRDPGRQALHRRQGARRVQEHSRAGRPRRAGRLPLLLDRRASLPRGVLALLEPRGAVRRDRGEDDDDAPRVRRAPTTQAVQPPDPQRGVGSRARPALRRPGRVRDRPLVDPGRDRRIRHRSPRHARHVVRGARAHRRRVDERVLPG